MYLNHYYSFASCLLISIWEFSSISNGEKVFLGKYKVPDKTKGPINIITEKAIRPKTDYPPLIFQGMKNNRVKLTNTGNSVEVKKTDSSPLLNITGGVFENDVYYFGLMKFLWTDNPKGISASTINGKGFPLEAGIYLFNKEYKTFQNSLNYRNGLASLIFHTSICSTPNKRFSDFAEKLKKVLHSGSSTTLKLGTSLEWFDTLPENVTYYAYPGEYHNLDDNQLYYCETVLIFDYHEPCISYKQFAETFESMKTPSNQPLTVTEKLYPFKQPVVRAKGIKQIIV